MNHQYDIIDLLADTQGFPIDSNGYMDNTTPSGPAHDR